MTITVTDGAGSVPPTAFGRDALDGHRQIKGLRRLLRRAHRALATGAKEVGAGLSATLPAAVRELSAIHTFALHMVKHPDMPADHRAYYLAEICRRSEEALEELS
jgi:hypothetical protein